MNRIDALRQAHWRTTQKDKRCRLCGGSTREGQPYCIRHFRNLTGCTALQHAAANHERLEECDVHIELRSLFSRISFDGAGAWIFSDGRRVVSSGGYRLIDRNGETTIAEFKSIADLLVYLREYSRIVNARNPYASKMLIR